MIPPVLKIQHSIVAYLSDLSSRLHYSFNTFPGVKEQEFMRSTGTGASGAPDSLFIELTPRPGGHAEDVSSVVKDILVLAPLLYRYRLVENISGNHSNRAEWHFLLLKALATAKASDSPAAAGDTEKGMGTGEAVMELPATAWTNHLQQAVLDLTPAYSARESASFFDDDQEEEEEVVEAWLRTTRERRCPALHRMLESLLHTDTPEGTTAAASVSQLVRMHGSSIQISLSTSGDDDGGDGAVMSRACLVHLVQSAAMHPSVVSISVGTAYHFANYDAIAMSQSGTAYKQPFRAAGLSGRHQVCGVADTGLDGE